METPSATLNSFISHGLQVIDTEASAVAALRTRLDQSFEDACQHLLNCRGRIVVMGMGKSGHIGGKIAATFASTGTPAFFVHPGEANHGDLGMITTQDVVLAISNSGETAEILTLIPRIKHLNIALITLTGRPASTLAKHASVNLDISVAEEACPLGLAPTTSTTCALVMGDALAIALLKARGFTREDFAHSHPGGRLGRRLLLHVSDLMQVGDAIPQVSIHAKLKGAIMEMTQKNLGMTLVADDHGKVVGLFTDGDLRRTLEKGLSVHTTSIDSVMNAQFRTILPTTLAAHALDQMEQYKITSLVVADSAGITQGVVHIHDILRAGLA